MAIRPAAHADDLFVVDRLDAERRRQSREAGFRTFAADCDAGATAIDDYGWKHSERVPPDRVVILLLGVIANIGEFADEAERIGIAQCEMVDPIDEPRAGVLAKFGGESGDDGISRGERIDGPRHPTGRDRLNLPIEIVCLFGNGIARGRHVRSSAGKAQKTRTFSIILARWRSLQGLVTSFHLPTSIVYASRFGFGRRQNWPHDRPVFDGQWRLRRARGRRQRDGARPDCESYGRESSPRGRDECDGFEHRRLKGEIRSFRR